VPVAFLGRGSVTVIVKDGAGNFVNGAQSRARLQRLWLAPPVSGQQSAAHSPRRACSSGRSCAGRDPRPTRSLASGSITATIRRHESRDVGKLRSCKERLSATDDYGFGRNRYAFGNISTVTDAQGRYALSFLPLGTSVISVHDQASRALDSDRSRWTSRVRRKPLT